MYRLLVVCDSDSPLLQLLYILLWWHLPCSWPSTVVWSSQILLSEVLHNRPVSLHSFSLFLALLILVVLCLLASVCNAPMTHSWGVPAFGACIKNRQKMKQAKDEANQY
jgi:hypothetical protein